MESVKIYLHYELTVVPYMGGIIPLQSTLASIPYAKYMYVSIGRQFLQTQLVGGSSLTLLPGRAMPVICNLLGITRSTLCHYSATMKIPSSHPIFRRRTELPCEIKRECVTRHYSPIATTKNGSAARYSDLLIDCIMG